MMQSNPRADVATRSDAARPSFPYAIRPCGSDDEDEILAVVTAALGGHIEEWRERWRWKHDLNPFGPSYRIAAIDPASGRIVGVRALMWWQFVDRDGVRVRAVRAVDTATHPSHQRRGIFSALTLNALQSVKAEGAAFVFNTPNRNSLPGYQKMGWRVAARVSPWIRPVRTVRAVASWLHRALARAPVEAADPGRAALVPWGKLTDSDIAAISELVDRHESTRLQAGWRTDRSITYLRWRYGIVPKQPYGVFMLRGTNQIDGVIIGRPVTGAGGASAVVVVELFVNEPSIESVRRLVRHYVRETNVDYLIAHFSPGTIERDGSRMAGFIPAPTSAYTWAIRPLAVDCPDLTARHAWDITMADLEVF